MTPQTKLNISRVLGIIAVSCIILFISLSLLIYLSPSWTTNAIPTIIIKKGISYEGGMEGRTFIMHTGEILTTKNSMLDYSDSQKLYDRIIIGQPYLAKIGGYQININTTIPIVDERVELFTSHRVLLDAIPISIKQ